MIKLFNSYIRSKLEYCCIVWSPKEQQYVNELEDMQRIFTSKIAKMEGLNYHQRLMKLNMYSLERRCDRYRLIYAWQQIEGIKENIMKLKISDKGSSRLINIGPISNNGKRLPSTVWNQVLNSPVRQTEKAFNCMPRYLRNMTGVKRDF